MPLGNSAAETALAAPSEQALRVPCYCEENVWRLAHRKLHHTKSNDSQTQQPSQFYVAIISNPSKCVCFFHQRANPDPQTPVFWDYHVILLEQKLPQPQQEEDATTQTNLVWDVDSYLPYPCLLSEYLQEAFPTAQDIGDPTQLEKIAPFFRVIPAALFLEKFRSDRSHMWDDQKQKWLATPPTYECILGNGNSCGDGRNGEESSKKEMPTIEKSNLMTYVSMTKHKNDPTCFGTVLTRGQLEERFIGSS